MVAPATLPSASPAPGSRWQEKIWLVVLVVGTWLAFINFPQLPPLGLDPSWRMALSYFTTTDLQFGTDIVFTAGPLGYLLSSSATGINYWHHLVWQLGVNLLLATGVVAAGRPLKGARALAYYVYFWGIAPGYLDTLHIVLQLVFSFVLLRDEVLRRRALLVLLTALLAVLALVKFTSLLLALTAVTALCAWLLCVRRWRDAAWLAGSFSAAFAAGWMAWGQSLLNLPAYFRNSLEVSSGYVDAMGLNESPAMLHTGLAVVAALAAYWLLSFLIASDRPRAAAYGLIGLAATFLQWKHGFVRADGHVYAFFFLGLFVGVSHKLWQPCTPRWRGAQVVVLTVIMLASLRGLWLQDTTKITAVGEFINRRLRDNALLVLHSPHLPGEARTAFAQMQRQLRLPTAQALAGRERVDLLGCDVGYAILNGFNYQPRPTIQGYVAMTPRLAQMNVDFYADPDRAPEVVLYRIETIDDRLPVLDDAPAIRYLLHHYDYVHHEGGFFLWQRRDHDPALDTREFIGEQTIHWGEQISTPMRGDQPIWCEIDIRPSLVGRLRRFFYKPPAVSIQTDDGGFDHRTFLFPPPMARAGFPAYPYFTNHDNVVNFEAGKLAPRLMRFSLVVPPGQERYFDPEISVRFYALPPYPRYGKDRPLPDAVRFRAFNRVPSSATGAEEAALVDDGEHVRLLVHAPSELTFDLERTVHQVHGKIGIFPGAYNGEGRTDGVGFRVEWISPEGSREVLWERDVVPLTVEEDRGEHSFAVTLPDSPGRLAFVTTNGPGGHPSFDWAYWSEVVFE